MTTLPREVLVPADAHVLGSPDAPVTIVEFGDLECPYCKDAAPVLRDVVEASDGRARLVFRHFPLFEVHPHALTAALAVEAAAAQGRFWPLLDALFAQQDDLSDAGIVRAAATLGIEPAGLVGEAAQRFGGVVERDYADGLAAGVAGTPTVFVDGVRLTGRVTRESVQAAVDARLRGSG
ncbi:protein-disulfide isomerase [Sediminihabitans luteus]|uniref:Protein-disulfide isomerase n=1 Tax=Sediminihabitans luteus TaxID=1138585 RepID=A0A2M9CYU9_9CELL|nr:DsbA family protein [Sediminihabitans luteus]PJJ77080.1 protein-disulfide isomerase [Sediminihabitans luteus]GIJ00401.1 hypothetical protein Slu03_27780 [Sediminihabitans luteus]